MAFKSHKWKLEDRPKNARREILGLMIDACVLRGKSRVEGINERYYNRIRVFCVARLDRCLRSVEWWNDDDDDDKDSMLTVMKYTYVANTRIRMRWDTDVEHPSSYVQFPCDFPSRVIWISISAPRHLSLLSLEFHVDPVQSNLVVFAPIRQIRSESPAPFTFPSFLADRITWSISRGLMTDPCWYCDQWW